jgi:hypothetical protein
MTLNKLDKRSSIIKVTSTAEQWGDNGNKNDENGNDDENEQ